MLEIQNYSESEWKPIKNSFYVSGVLFNNIQKTKAENSNSKQLYKFQATFTDFREEKDYNLVGYGYANNLSELKTIMKFPFKELTDKLKAKEIFQVIQRISKEKIKEALLKYLYARKLRTDHKIAIGKRKQKKWGLILNDEDAYNNFKETFTSFNEELAIKYFFSVDNYIKEYVTSKYNDAHQTGILEIQRMINTTSIKENIERNLGVTIAHNVILSLLNSLEKNEYVFKKRRSAYYNVVNYQTYFWELTEKGKEYYLNEIGLN